jgi:hypothetical protein
MSVLFVLVIGLPARAQVLPSARAVDWSHAGIPGGIPGASWPVAATLSPSGGDDSVAIQNAINAAPAKSVIVLNPGTYKLSRSAKVCPGKSDDGAYGVYRAGLCLTDKSVVLRGAGPHKTVLQYGGGANIISMGRTYLSSSQVALINITAGAAKGSTQITLQSSSGVGPGTYLTITQTNPKDSDGSPLVDSSGYCGCSYCGHDMPNKAMTQINRVTGVSGNTVTLERPLYIDYTSAPQAFTLKMVENVGLEDLRLQSTASSGSGIVYKNVNIESCARCWVHNVESDWAVDRSHIYLSDVYGCEISNNYVNEGYNHNSGLDYAIFLEFRGSENLIQNNIIRKARHSMVNVGGSGNVWAYNYVLDPYMGEYHNSLAESNTHGAHPYMDLLEGNVTPNIEFDNAHGSSSHNTLFRNYVNLTAENPDTNKPMTGALFAVNFAYQSNYNNVLGNVIGPYGQTCTANAYEINADGPQSSSIYKFGYYDDGGTSSPNATLSAKVGKTVLRGGNWDCRTKAVIWSNNVPGGSLKPTYLAQQSLPASLYLSSKPGWFGAVPWPAIDPAAAGKVNKIPAQLCYESGPGSGKAFNPAACYGASSTSAPGAPQNLRVVPLSVSPGGPKVPDEQRRRRHGQGSGEAPCDVGAGHHPLGRVDELAVPQLVLGAGGVSRAGEGVRVVSPVKRDHAEADRGPGRRERSGRGDPRPAADPAVSPVSSGRPPVADGFQREQPDRELAGGARREHDLGPMRGVEGGCGCRRTDLDPMAAGVVLAAVRRGPDGSSVHDDRGPGDVGLDHQGSAHLLAQLVQDLDHLRLQVASFDLDRRIQAQRLGEVAPGLRQAAGGGLVEAEVEMGARPELGGWLQLEHTLQQIARPVELAFAVERDGPIEGLPGILRRGLLRRGRSGDPEPQYDDQHGAGGGGAGHLRAWWLVAAADGRARFAVGLASV